MDETVPDNALPVMGQAAAGEEQSARGQDQNLVMTPEAMNELKENLPANEKSNIFNILMNKLPPGGNDQDLRCPGGRLDRERSNGTAGNH
ncbi:hypothetical protein ACFTAO_47705 [Paenibacillus rhizoplanae]